MRILVVAATEQEVALIRNKAERKPAVRYKAEFLITGVGMTATTYSMMKKLVHHTGGNGYDLALNIGLAGSYREEISIGEVVSVVSDQFADLGAEDGDDFLTAFEMGLMPHDHFPFWNGRLKCSEVNNYATLHPLKKVTAITVNKVHGNEKSIHRTLRKFHPDIESMEGAAFHYVCHMEKLPGIQLRAVSNRVERRNRLGWDTQLAIDNLSDVVLDFLSSAE